MRSKLLLLLLVICSLSSLSAQLYDSRGRYLQRKADDFEKIYKPRTLNSHSSTTRSSTIPRSYSRYRAKTSNYNRRGLSSDRFYDKFRDPEIYELYDLKKSGGIANSESEEHNVKFSCYCNYYSELSNLDRFIRQVLAEFQRQYLINGFEKIYLSKFNQLLNLNYQARSSFKEAKKSFFDTYINKFNSPYVGGQGQKYAKDHERFISDLNKRHKGV